MNGDQSECRTDHVGYPRAEAYPFDKELIDAAAEELIGKGWTYVGSTYDGVVLFIRTSFPGKNTVEQTGDGVEEPGPEHDAIRSTGGGEVDTGC